MSNLNLLEQVSLKYSIQSISGALMVTNNTYITNQPYFLNTYLSTVSIHNSSIHDITSDSSVLIAAGTNIELNGLVINNLYANGLGKFVQYLLTLKLLLAI